MDDKKKEKEEAFTGTPEEKLPDMEAEKMENKKEEQSDKESGSGDSESR